jgi:hypothetical protein
MAAAGGRLRREGSVAEELIQLTFSSSSSIFLTFPFTLHITAE